MGRGRPRLSPRRQLLIRIPEELFAEILLLNPQMQDETGLVRYGAISQYFNTIARHQLEERRSQLRREMQKEQTK